MEDLLVRNAAFKAANAHANTPSRSSRQKRGIGYTSDFWPNGSTLRIAFVDEDLAEDHKQGIIDAISQWQPYVNLTFEFIDGREDQPDYGKGDIRITTKSSANFSLFGSQAKRNDPWTPTMVLGIRPYEPKFASTVMHEFGHALGAQHEHQHPEADIPWDVPKVYAFYAEKGHDEETVNESVLTKLPQTSALMLPYDRQSIMHYPVRNELTIGDWEIGDNMTLSEKDKAFMRRAYPHN